jgi:hypothetical protein
VVRSHVFTGRASSIYCISDPTRPDQYLASRRTYDLKTDERSSLKEFRHQSTQNTFLCCSSVYTTINSIPRHELNMSHVAAASATEPQSVYPRPTVNGKFLAVGDETFWVRGVSYGTFQLDAAGHEAFTPDMVEKDFAAMAANGLNVVRIYTVPPRWVLDAALKHGLRVMIGLPWEQHIAFLDERGKADEIEQRLRRYVRSCAGHPAAFCYTIGNEIPSSIVRWHGRQRIEAFLNRLYRATKAEDPTALVTYVNFPTTEYLQLASCMLSVRSSLRMLTS